jgi:DNA mismatch repair protein MSH2
VQIRRRHDVVEALAGDAALREALRGPFLRHMPDLDRLARKLERKRTSLQDLCRLYQVSYVRGTTVHVNMQGL